jgi:hypothetical protein
VVASEKQGEPDTALNQLSRIQDSDVRQDDVGFQRQRSQQGSEKAAVQKCMQPGVELGLLGISLCCIPKPRCHQQLTGSRAAQTDWAARREQPDKSMLGTWQQPRPPAE